MRQLLREAHFHVEHEALGNVVRMTRQPTRIETADELDRAYAAVITVLDGVRSPKVALVIDIRNGAMKNDPVFERVIERHRRRMTAGFGRIVVIVESALGAAQVERHGRADATAYQVFSDEAQALAAAREPIL